MIIVYEGCLGSGKTYNPAKKIVEELLKGHKPTKVLQSTEQANQEPKRKDNEDISRA
jgi:rRNA processing protein Krr1/Pno1